MLEIRPSCEHCDKPLPNDSDEAMICTFECTYCKDCVDNVLHNVCPNCGGGFEKRPTRPSIALRKSPAGERRVHKPVNEDHFKVLLAKYKDVEPRKR